MLKVCYLVLTLATGHPTLVNFNEVIAVLQGEQDSMFTSERTKIYFGSGVLSSSSISVKNSVEEIATKLEACNPDSETYFYVSR